MNRQALAAFGLVACLSGALLFFRLGERPFRNPDEGRYAQVAREILESGDWVRPTLYGVGYFRKPALFYWLIASSFNAFGYSEFAARSVPALFGLATIGAVFWFTRRFFGVQAAVFASTMLATNFWYLQTARFLVIDAVFAFFVVAALFCFYLARVAEGARPAWYLAFCASLSLAFLTKGFLALALVLAPAGLYLAWTGSLGKALRARWFLGMAAVFAGVALPWYWMLEKREPGFLMFFLGHENLKRFVSSDFEHQEPWFYYLWVLPLMLLPWILFVRPIRAAFSGLAAGAAKDPRFFLAICASVMLVFFSASRSKMPTYLMPILPLVLTLLAAGWARWVGSGPKLGKAEYAGVAFIFFVGIATMVGGPWYAAQRAHRFPDPAALDLQLIGGGILAGGVLCFASAVRSCSRRLFYSLAALMAGLSVLFTPFMITMNRQYTTKHFAEYLRPEARPADEIYIYDHPGPFYDFAYYLGRPVTLVGLEGELEHFSGDPNAPHVSVTHERFFEKLLAKRPLYCLIRKSDFQGLAPEIRAPLRVLKQDNRKVLFSSGFQGGHT